MTPNVDHLRLLLSPEERAIFDAKGKAAQNRRYAERHRAMGLCIVCPAKLSEGSTRLCDFHLRKDRERAEARRRAKGMRVYKGRATC